MDKARQGEKSLSGLHFVITAHQTGQEVKQGRCLEAGGDAEALEEAAYWLACCP